HPTGRLIGSRAGSPVNTSELISMAEDPGTVLEVDANPRRPDPSSDVIRQPGLKLTANTAAPHPGQRELMNEGVATPRRGLSQKGAGINTYSRDVFRECVKKGK